MQINDYVIVKDQSENVLLSGRIVKQTDNPCGFSLSCNEYLFINPNSEKFIIQKSDFAKDTDCISKSLDEQSAFAFYKHNNIDNTFDYDFFMWGEIEPEVKEICELLNQITGIETYSSCSGHGKIPPYVDFFIKDIDTFYDLLEFLKKNGQPSKTAKHNDVKSAHRFVLGVEGRGTCHLEALEINSDFKNLRRVLKKYLML